jgi:tRNA modification GTPase
MSGSDTIAAIATAPGRGGVAVVRVSGPDAWEVAGKVSGRQISASDAGRFFYCDFRDADGEVADSGLLLVFKAPASYTGEDVVEFQGHGGSVAPRRVLEACFAAGARLARRGEFTERAFLNGKLDLSAAEAVIDLVDARTDRAADDAQARMRGALSVRYEKLYGDAVDASSRMEYLLDVDEGEIPDGTMEAYAADIDGLKDRIKLLLATAHEGRILREGALVVLAGAPNAGKSSLMNALLGAKRAIVSDIAGTTRDSIEEGLDIDGWPVRLVDTAGLRTTDDVVEAEGVERAEELMLKAAEARNPAANRWQKPSRRCAGTQRSAMMPTRAGINRETIPCMA